MPTEIKRLAPRRWFWRTEAGSGVAVSELKAQKAAEGSLFYSAVARIEESKTMTGVPMPDHVRAEIKAILKAGKRNTLKPIFNNRKETP